MVVLIVVQVVMLWVQKILPCLWDELMNFSRGNTTKLDLIFGKQKSWEPFAVGKQEKERLLGPLGFHLFVKGG